MIFNARAIMVSRGNYVYPYSLLVIADVPATNGVIHVVGIVASTPSFLGRWPIDASRRIIREAKALPWQFPRCAH